MTDDNDRDELQNEDRNEEIVDATLQHTPPPAQASGKDTAHIVTDLVVGPNIRLKDNLYQGLFIFVMVIVGAIVGSVIMYFQANPNNPWFVGAIGGAFAGLLIGLFTSGIFLMIYRAVRHAKGKHD